MALLRLCGCRDRYKSSLYVHANLDLILNTGSGMTFKLIEPDHEVLELIT